MAKTDTEEVKIKTKKTQNDLFIGTGRRKTAIARVFLKEEKGEFIVNGKDISEYFSGEMAQTQWTRPFHAVGISHPKAKYSATIKVLGSGIHAQLEAVIHGIAKALALISDENKVMVAKQGLLTRDPRMVERKKYFLHKARKRPQYSKR